MTHARTTTNASDHARDLLFAVPQRAGKQEEGGEAPRTPPRVSTGEQVRRRHYIYTNTLTHARTHAKIENKNRVPRQQTKKKRERKKTLYTHTARNGPEAMRGD